MKAELTALMRRPGYRVEWRDPRVKDRSVDNAELVVMELRGFCGIPAVTVPPEPLADPGGTLASTYV